MNSQKNNNLYELSKQLEEEELRSQEEEAKKILKAYRQVEQLKVDKPQPGHAFK